VERTKALLLSGLFMTAVSCSAGAEKYDLIGEFPVPDGASDVKRLVLGASAAQQLFFQIREPYPSTRVLGVYRDFLRAHGWIQCADANKDWASHEDRSSKPYLLVHEISEHWAKRDDRKLLILSTKYYSKNLSNDRPDSDEQRVIVWVQRVADLERELSELGVDCGSESK